MSNTAIAIREAMTCLCAAPEHQPALGRAKTLFDELGKTLLVSEEMMLPATALAGCGIAFFLRAIRAASQGGTQIGFHSEEALLMAAQTARGAASLLLSTRGHPESEIDKVTTPRGCTIEGLNEMEHHGFSSAMITGIVTSSNKAAKLFKEEN
jgi:pyrroline-5-carboxylate reductase